ncbi:three-helix bundle dimerization domain-containing protein [Amycolatopsis sp. GM8]|uniref:three-helix bundle dimerization domain-containing protein n=1 Tax=Amycolatopsis sp. GM8 TaxID=2896530 RepID=UPI001F2711B6|nr:HD domain-containing protein [Amycolatopsis sp. GM8]
MDTAEAAHGKHVDEMIERLEARLRAEQDQVSPTVLHDWIEHARARFAQARIVSFVPIFVERLVRAQLQMESSAENLAKRLLADDMPRRWVHTQAVAHRAGTIAPRLVPGEGKFLVASAWLHDIGYGTEVADTGFHQLDGARYLTRRGWPDRICALVAHHAGADAVARLNGFAEQLAAYEDERTPVRDALWYCDMTTSPDGEPVSFGDRIADIKARRGPDDPAVRALAVNEQERAAAVRRTEELLAAS